MAPVIKAFKDEKIFDKKVYCCTTQANVSQVLDIFDISPDYGLNIMERGQDLFDITANVLFGMKNVFSEYSPDLVLVHGDTSTTCATSIAAFYQKIKVGHVEAGLRTGNIYSPWPEEVNRQISGDSKLSFCTNYNKHGKSFKRK